GANAVRRDGISWLDGSTTHANLSITPTNTEGRTMDKFTQAAAAHHLVEAYKKVTAEYLALRPLDVTISDDAPETYEALVADAAQGKLRISPANSGATIYGHAGNMAFRT